MRILATILLVLPCLGCGPLVTIPGGALSGDLTPIPSDWKFTDSIEIVQLETRPSDPYSVNIWAVASGDNLYFATGETDWASFIDTDPQVRLRIDGKIYELKATKTDVSGERTAVLAALKRKYDFEPDAEQEATASLYRLDAR